MKHIIRAENKPSRTLFDVCRCIEATTCSEQSRPKCVLSASPAPVYRRVGHLASHELMFPCTTAWDLRGPCHGPHRVFYWLSQVFAFGYLCSHFSVSAKKISRQGAGSDPGGKRPIRVQTGLRVQVVTHLRAQTRFLDRIRRYRTAIWPRLASSTGTQKAARQLTIRTRRRSTALP